MRRIGMIAFGACLLAGPLYAQGQKCQGNSSSTASTSTSTTATGTRSSRAMNSTTTTSTSTDTQIAQLQNQISQTQRLVNMLQSGEVTPPANSGVSSAQAVQVLQRRISYMQNAVQQLSASRNSSNSANMARRR